jgi:hypothetical protein
VVSSVIKSWFHGVVKEKTLVLPEDIQHFISQYDFFLFHLHVDTKKRK